MVFKFFMPPPHERDRHFFFRGGRAFVGDRHNIINLREILWNFISQRRRGAKEWR